MGSDLLSTFSHLTHFCTDVLGVDACGLINVLPLTLLGCLNNHAPTEKKKNSRPRFPWWNFMQMIKIRVPRQRLYLWNCNSAIKQKYIREYSIPIYSSFRFILANKLKRCWCCSWPHFCWSELKTVVRNACCFHCVCVQFKCNHNPYMT